MGLWCTHADVWHALSSPGCKQGGALGSQSPHPYKLTQTRVPACCCVQVTQALCTLLALLLPRVPNAVLRAKFVPASGIISTVLGEHKEQVGGAEPCVH